MNSLEIVYYSLTYLPVYHLKKVILTSGYEEEKNIIID